MKKILLLASLISVETYAQSNALNQDNEPTYSEILYMYQCAPMDPLDNINGSGVTWDFTQLVGLNSNSLKSISVSDPSQTQYKDIFTTSTKGYEVQGSLTVFFNSTATERISQGFVFQEPTLGNIVAHFDANEQKIVSYPFSYGDVLTDDFAGTLLFSLSGNTQNPPCSGISHSSIDGLGTLKLPVNSSFNWPTTTFENVIRYKIVDTIYTQATLFTPLDLIFVRKHYEYYDLNFNNLPLFTHTFTSISQVGSATPLSTQTYVLSQVQPNYVAGINNYESSEFNIYPNPAKDAISIKGNFNSSSTATINDINGRTIKTLNIPENGKEIDLTDLEPGSYFIIVESDGQIKTEKLILE